MKPKYEYTIEKATFDNGRDTHMLWRHDNTWSNTGRGHWNPWKLCKVGTEAECETALLHIAAKGHKENE